MRLGKLTTAIAVSALLLAACGGTTTTQGSTQPATKTSTNTSSGVITDGLFEEPNVLNPILGPRMGFA